MGGQATLTLLVSLGVLLLCPGQVSCLPACLPSKRLQGIVVVVVGIDRRRLDKLGSLGGGG